MLWRKVRSPESGENTEITIVSIICRKAKEQGNQYTERLLPAFLIPFCQIGREGVLRYLRLYAKGRIVYRIASAMLGARDWRTIRRHLAMGLAEIGQAALQLATLLSQVLVYATVAERPLGQSDCQYLEALAEQVHRAGRRAHGGSVPRIPAVAYVHLASVFSRSSRPLVPPLRKAKLSPGKNLRIYRQNKGMTQKELGGLLGGVPRQHISNMEKGTRSISKKVALKLAEIFIVTVEKFIG